MSGFQLTASLVSSLAWPILAVAVLVFVWFKRHAISELVNLHSTHEGRTLKRLRAGPVELEWDQLIETTVKQISDIQPEPPSARKTREPGVSSARKARASEELLPLSRRNPAAAVLEAFDRVDEKLRSVVVNPKELVDDEPTNPSFNAMIFKAFSQKMISGEIFGAMNNLARLRNEAAHRVGGDEISSGQAYEYLVIVDHVLEALEYLSHP